MYRVIRLEVALAQAQKELAQRLDIAEKLRATHAANPRLHPRMRVGKQSIRNWNEQVGAAYVEVRRLEREVSAARLEAYGPDGLT